MFLLIWMCCDWIAVVFPIISQFRTNVVHRIAVMQTDAPMKTRVRSLHEKRSITKAGRLRHSIAVDRFGLYKGSTYPISNINRSRFYFSAHIFYLSQLLSFNACAHDSDSRILLMQGYQVSIEVCSSLKE